MSKNDLKFVYLRDPEDFRRVLTIAWCYDEKTNFISYNYAINKIAEKSELRLDDRLRLFIGNPLFKELQKRFNKRFGGDQHSRKQARAVVTGKYRKCCYHVECHEGNKVFKIVKDLHSRLNEGVSYKQYLIAKRIFEDLNDKQNNKVNKAS